LLDDADDVDGDDDAGDDDDDDGEAERSLEVDVAVLFDASGAPPSPKISPS
jgi:hypothetical protein